MVKYMKKYNIQSALLRAVATFGILYLPIHILIVYFDKDIDWLIPASLVCGIFLSFAFKLLRIEIKSYWAGLTVFAVLYCMVLGISAVLFYSHPYEGSIMWQVFYYFPQMLAVAFMIPGAVIHWILIRLKYFK